MLLVDQVELLRQNLVQIRSQQLALPLMGGLSATKQAYQFKYLVHPARDIATTIAEADPGGDKLPTHLGGWDLNVTDEFREPQRIHLKKLLGMVIHLYYLRIEDDNLDISNDLGNRIIVPYSVFLDSVERLVLTPEDICLVICSLAEENLKNKDSIRALEPLTPGSGNLEHCLATINKWQPLQENIWRTFFADKSTAVRANCQTVNNQPFTKGTRFIGTTVMWHVGWRRDGTYAESWLNISHLIGEIQDYFRSIPHKGN